MPRRRQCSSQSNRFADRAFVFGPGPTWLRERVARLAIRYRTDVHECKDQPTLLRESVNRTATSQVQSHLTSAQQIDSADYADCFHCRAQKQRARSPDRPKLNFPRALHLPPESESHSCSCSCSFFSWFEHEQEQE